MASGQRVEEDAGAGAVITAAETHLRARVVAEVERRLGGRGRGAELARRSGQSESHVNSALSGTSRLLARDLLAWGMALGLDLFDLMPRDVIELFAPEDVLKLPLGWLPGLGAPPRFENNFATLVVSDVTTHLRVYTSDDDVMRLLRATTLQDAVVRSLVRRGIPAGHIDLDVSVGPSAVRGWAVSTIDVVSEHETGTAVAIAQLHAAIPERVGQETVYRKILALVQHPAASRVLLILADRRYPTTIAQRLRPSGDPAIGETSVLPGTELVRVLGTPDEFPDDVMLTCIGRTTAPTGSALLRWFEVK